MLLFFLTSVFFYLLIYSKQTEGGWLTEQSLLLGVKRPVVAEVLLVQMGEDAVGVISQVDQDVVGVAVQEGRTT
jgi:hypothetical protein